ncbi:translationally-controlled tumor protein homolog [Pollicipes pollicipes]|uniref:translationally-controlled tumor protein homolog n=1 Tax=Pollicipes pollicipes TaxID=41117 RepID=UPI0018856E80|nr:translationally-controlled tumor protein homolog [Pollicipes pollicipes]XP_037075553.1 translationally-controlled tumor protein homolog [Pollicipes pollicipes]
MKVYKDIISGDEMFMDTYTYETIHDAVYRVEGKYITRSKVGELVLDGANPSAEDAEEATDDDNESGVDVVLNMRLTETGFSDKKAYISYLKDYMKAICTKLAETSPDQVDTFKNGSNAFIKEKIGKFKDMQFFQGEGMNPDGMVAIMLYEDKDGSELPFMYFFKHGLEEEKL